MYRAVAWYLTRKAVDMDDQQALTSALGQISLELLPAADEFGDVGVLLNGEDISGQIRTPEMSMLASTVSTRSAVRDKLTALQRAFGERGGIVAEGRDTGTVVFPGAGHKFYLDASAEARAQRRARQLMERGQAVDQNKLLEMTIARDGQDCERTLAPLKKADDATLIDTTDLSIDQVFAAITEAIAKTAA
jgi:cytidylate kinase